MTARPLIALSLAALAAACSPSDAAETEAAPAPPAAEVAAAPATDVEAPAADATGDVVEVRMVSTPTGGSFEPAEVTVRPGDVIRFTTDGTMPHNVAFPAAANAGASNLPAPGPYLTDASQTYELPVTMAPGTYEYDCTPHAALGMKGRIVVAE